MPLIKKKSKKNFQLIVEYLTSNEILLRRVFDILDDCIIITDAEGKCLYANHSSLRQLGLEGKTSLLGRDVHQRC